MKPCTVLLPWSAWALGDLLLLDLPFEGKGGQLGPEVTVGSRVSLKQSSPSGLVSRKRRHL